MSFALFQLFVLQIRFTTFYRISVIVTIEKYKTKVSSVVQLVEHLALCSWFEAGYKKFLFSLL